MIRIRRVTSEGARQFLWPHYANLSTKSFLDCLQDEVNMHSDWYNLEINSNAQCQLNVSMNTPE